MKTDLNKYVDVIENLDWWIDIDFFDDYAEIGYYTSAGEDFFFSVSTDDLPLRVSEYYYHFDPEEHVRMWLEAKNSGVDGVPSLWDLIEDAKEIETQLEDLSIALCKAARTA